MGELDGRAAIVTGASQGLGKEIVGVFLDAGATVVACARSIELPAHERLLQRRCDVSNREQVEAFVAEAITRFPHLDILVNSAGIYGPKGLIEDTSFDEWVRAIEIDLFGAVLLARSIVPHFRKLDHGKFIQLSGGGATNPMPRISAYAAAKAAVVRFCESLALEVADAHVDVNCIAPGALNTRMLDEVIEAGPDKVGKDFYERSLKQKQSGGAGLDKGAALALWLASRESDGITGRLLSALWDPWQTLAEHRTELATTDIYTLRRITARERGKDWES